MKALVTIRAFAPEDMCAVMEMLQDVSDYRPSAHEISSLPIAFLSTSNAYACVAMQDERLIGFGSVFFLSRIRGGRSAIIEDVVVASHVRGQGVGRGIIEALLEAARLQGCFKVSLEAAGSAESFYKALGFESAGKVMKISLLRN